MEFDKIIITITKLEDGRWHLKAEGERDREDETSITHLGSVTAKDKSTIIDWFIEKVEAV